MTQNIKELVALTRKHNDARLAHLTIDPTTILEHLQRCTDSLESDISRRAAENGGAPPTLIYDCLWNPLVRRIYLPANPTDAQKRLAWDNLETLIVQYLRTTDDPVFMAFNDKLKALDISATLVVNTGLGELKIVYQLDLPHTGRPTILPRGI